jgi:glycosyltransferase involved in cell wall biosynthesis
VRGTIDAMSGDSGSPAARRTGEFAEGPSNVSLVTIGMPVYNGARYLEEAVRSILNQTERDFLLLISDNCSTDATAAICQRLASEDSRIKYYRQPSNLGAIANFGFVLQAARSPFFMWAAHDDIRSPDCLSESLATLSENPEAAGCAMAVQVVDDAGMPLRLAAAPCSRIGSSDVVRRCRSITLDPGGFAVYSLFRRDMLPAFGRQPNIVGFHHAYVFNVALNRPFVTTQRPLLVYREAAGWVPSLGPDKRIHWSKGAGEESNLYNGPPTDMCRYMWACTDEAPITRTQRMLLRIHIVRLWIRLNRLRSLDGNKLQLQTAMSRHQFARLTLLVSVRFALAPIPTTNEAGRFLKKWWYRTETAA